MHTLLLHSEAPLDQDPSFHIPAGRALWEDKVRVQARVAPESLSPGPVRTTHPGLVLTARVAEVRKLEGG